STSTSTRRATTARTRHWVRRRFRTWQLPSVTRSSRRPASGFGLCRSASTTFPGRKRCSPQPNLNLLATSPGISRWGRRFVGGLQVPLEHPRPALRGRHRFTVGCSLIAVAVESAVGEGHFGIAVGRGLELYGDFAR